MSTNNISPISTRSSARKFLLWFFLCCSLPLVAAKLAVEFSWFTGGINNKGQWLEQEIQLLSVSPGPHWYLVYIPAHECDLSCEGSLSLLQQIHLSFGRQQQEIVPLILAAKAPPQLGYFPSLTWRAASAQSADLHNQIFIVNRKGIAILRYPAARDQQQMLSVGKDIRTDLRRLLAYDRGGA